MRLEEQEEERQRWMEEEYSREGGGLGQEVKDEEVKDEEVKDEDMKEGCMST